jgi:hypothetical protein
MTATRTISELKTSVEEILRVAARGWKVRPCKARDKTRLKNSS